MSWWALVPAGNGDGHFDLAIGLRHPLEHRGGRAAGGLAGSAGGVGDRPCLARLAVNSVAFAGVSGGWLMNAAQKNDQKHEHLDVRDFISKNGRFVNDP